MYLYASYGSLNEQLLLHQTALTFPIQNGLKQRDVLWALFSNFAIRKVQAEIGGHTSAAGLC